ncbi:MAG: glycosyltransferase family 4 protein [Candidatus Woesearchaeota archaeon]|jgi:glycosyltransferase involved in cell wall biosynthesis
MEIAIINKYQNKVNRGAETFVSELSKRLSKNHQVDILTKINFFKKYDIVIPTNGRLQVFIVRILTWLTGSKMIVSGQSGVGLDDRLNLYAMPNVFVAISSYALDKSKKINPFVKSLYIPNGVDLDKFKLQGPTLQLRLEKPVILCVSALVDWKRLDLIIKAVSKLKKGSLLLVGKGDQENNLQKLGDKLLPNRFKILSFEHKDMPKVYKSADLFTFSTVPWESFGIVLVEAMASGLPVVATDDPIRREIVGDAGLFIDPSDTDAYAKALENALSINWGSKPRKQAEKFSWDKIALEYEKLFQKL